MGKISALENEVKSIKRHHDSFKEQCEALQLKLSAKITECDDMFRQNNEEVLRITKEWKDLSQEKIAKAQADLDAKRQLIHQQSEAAQSKLRKTIETDKKTISALKDQNDELRSLEPQNLSLEGEIAELKDKIERLEKAKAISEQQAKSVISKSNATKALETDLNGMRLERNQVNEQLALMQDLERKVDDLDKQRDELNSELQGSKALVSDRDQRIQSLMEDLTKTSTNAEQLIEGLRSDKASLTIEKTKPTGQLQLKSEELQSSNNQLEVLKVKMKQLQSEHDGETSKFKTEVTLNKEKAAGDIEQLNSKLTSKDNEIESLTKLGKEECENLWKKNEALKENHVLDIAIHEKTANNLKNDLKEKEATITELSSKVDETQGKLNEAVDHAKSLREQLSSANDELKRERPNIAHLHTLTQQLRHQLAEKTTEALRAASSSRSNREGCSRYVLKNNALEKEVADMKALFQGIYNVIESVSLSQRRYRLTRKQIQPTWIEATWFGQNEQPIHECLSIR